MPDDSSLLRDQRICERLQTLAMALDGVSVKIDYDPNGGGEGTGVWDVEVDQGIGYKPQWRSMRGANLEEVLDSTLTLVGA